MNYSFRCSAVTFSVIRIVLASTPRQIQWNIIEWLAIEVPDFVPR